MTRVVKAQSEDKPDLEYIKRLAEEFKKSKEVQDEIEKRTNNLKKELTSFVETYGVPDDKGHVWLQAGDIKLKRERRVTRSFDSNSAREWAEETGHWDQIKEVVEVLSEDKLLGLAWSNKDLEETIQNFYIEKESWAFKV